MNERLQELARQAGFFANPDVEKFEKFAELIVQECMTICKNHPSRIVPNNWKADAVAPDIVHRLSEHFGVKE